MGAARGARDKYEVWSFINGHMKICRRTFTSSHWLIYCSKGGCWLTWHPSFSIPTCCKLQNSHGFLWNNWWKKFKLLSETILVAKYCTVSQICTLKGGHFSLLLGTIFVRVLSTGAGKNLPPAFLELINLQTVSQGQLRTTEFSLTLNCFSSAIGLISFIKHSFNRLS